MALFDETEEVTVETLVGEGKKYKDVNDLAKSYAHAAAALEDRERQLAGLREDLNTRLSVEDQLKEFQKATTSQPQDQVNTQTPNPASGDQNDLAKRVREVIEQERQETSRRSNQEVVQAKLTELFGTPEKAAQVVRAKAAELGVSLQFMESIALQSPKAFFTQLGVTDAPRNQTSVTPSRGDVNPRVLDMSTGAPREGTYEFFEDLRKNRPSVYWDPKTQSKLHKAAADGTYLPPDSDW